MAGLRPIGSVAAATSAALIAAAPVRLASDLAWISGGTAWALGSANLVGSAVSTVFLICWLWRVRANVKLLTGAPWFWNNGWIVSCFIPIVSIYVLYKVVLEVWDRSWQPRPRLLRVWWQTQAGFILATVGLVAVFGLRARFGWLFLVPTALGIVGTVLTVMVISRVSALQDGLVPAAANPRRGLVLGAGVIVVACALAAGVGSVAHRQITESSAVIEQKGYAYGWSLPDAGDGNDQCDAEGHRRYSAEADQLLFETYCLNARTDRRTGNPNPPPALLAP